tara:strand:- start:473 stop:1030 length:558 start_codon:yes stop_codon:yes gene_type:complete
MKKKIKELLEPLDKDIINPEFDKQTNEIPTESDLFIIDTAPNAVSVSVNPAISEKSASGILAKRLAEMLYNGASKAEALKSLGVSDHEIDLRALAIETNSFLLKTYSFPDEARRLMVKAGLNKLFTEAMMSNDADTMLKAAKQIASDPDVGLNAPPQQIINISLEKAQQALETANTRPEFDFDKE